MTLADNGQVWRWNGSQGWSLLGGDFVSLAVAAQDQAWGLRANHQVDEWRSGFWQALPGDALMLAVSPERRLWAVMHAPSQRTYALHRWLPRPQRWQERLRLPGPVRSLALGAQEEPWIVTDHGRVQVWRQTQWMTLPDIDAVHVAVSANGVVYAVDQGSHIHWLDVAELRWKPATGRARQIALDPQGGPWAISPEGQALVSTAFEQQHETRQLAKAAAQARVAALQPPAVTVLPGPLPTLNRPLRYQTLTGDVRLKDLGIGVDGTVMGVGQQGELLCFNNKEQRFELASLGRSERMAIGPGGRPWLLDVNGLVTRFDGEQWLPVAEFKGRDIATGPDGEVWALDQQGRIHRYRTSVHRFLAEPVLRSDVPVNGLRLAGARDQVVWVAQQGGQLLRCDKGICTVKQIGVRDVAVAPDNTVFALSLLGEVLMMDARTGQFSPREGNGAVIDVGPQGLPWLLAADGQVSYAGLFFPDSKRINTADCARPYQGRPTLAPPTPASAVTPPPAAATVPDAPQNIAPAPNPQGLPPDYLVSFSPPTNDGGSPIVSYTVTAYVLDFQAMQPIDVVSASGPVSPVPISFQVQCDMQLPISMVRFEVVATNAVGSSAPSPQGPGSVASVSCF